MVYYVVMSYDLSMVSLCFSLFNCVVVVHVFFSDFAGPGHEILRTSKVILGSKRI